MWTKPGYAPAHPARREPPEDNGQRLATFPRGKTDELRLSIGEFNGIRFVNFRLWSKNDQGDWWPTPKGATLRARELDEAIEALTVARDLLDQNLEQPQARRNHR